MSGDLLQQFTAELVAERFGATPPWRERWARPDPARHVDNEATLARRRRDLNEAMDGPVDGAGFGRRAA